MNILAHLSSQTGDKTETSNKAVAVLCLNDPKLLKEISSGLSQKNIDLVADCGEVMTFVAEKNPALVSAYISEILPLIKHKKTKARWEAMHAISLIAHIIPDVIESILLDLEDLIQKDSSTIVRDYTTETISTYSGLTSHTAKTGFPYLKLILDKWQDKHAGRALDGMFKAYQVMPSLKKEILAYAIEYSNSPKGVAKKAANKILKALS
jgi:hypothetical protein